MSSAEARATINRVIKNVLESESPRKKLDTSVHVLDLSYSHVIMANQLPNSKDVLDAYKEFISALRSLPDIGISESLSSAIELVTAGKKPQYIIKYRVLVCKDFRKAREAVTQISKSIPDNQYFGISYRERSLTELKTAYKIEEGSSLGPLKDKAFVLGDGRIGIVQQVPDSRKVRYSLQHIDQLPNNYKFLALREPVTNKISIESYTNHIGGQVSSDNGVIELIDTEHGKIPLLKRGYLSKLDLGHLFKKETRGGRTPLGERLQKAFTYRNLSPEARQLVQHYIDDLDKEHGKVTYIFHNRAAQGEATKLQKKVGIVVITVQYYRENNRLAVQEARIKRQLTKKLSEMAGDIEGSNTIFQDSAQVAINSVVTRLGGKAKKLKPHSPVRGEVPITDTGLPKIALEGISGPKKSGKSSKSAESHIKVVNTGSGSIVPLTSLQILINTHLQDVISANMGDGDSRRILNYRTGRFAASARVERMSESRAGMITAFYDYMKYPYQTFEPGFKQGSPKTRDPKLLISLSIREIAATKVGNRLRAVLV